jgi:hypothetical protein
MRNYGYHPTEFNTTASILFDIATCANPIRKRWNYDAPRSAIQVSQQRFPFIPRFENARSASQIHVLPNFDTAATGLPLDPVRYDL